MKRIAWLALLLLTPLPALPAAAQEYRTLTADDARAIVAFHNQPATIRLTGESRIPAGTEAVGNVASIGGPLIVEGDVRGDVVVINGDLHVAPGGRVTGSATVAGGRFYGEVQGVSGPTVVYPEAVRFRREGDRLIAIDPGPDSWFGTGWVTRFGRADLTLTVDGSYNRVEGLPIEFGPRIELGSSNPTVLDARLIYRTRSGLRIHPEEFGRDIRLEQYLGGHRSLRVGFGAHQEIDPIELNGVSDAENSLSTFLLHRDYRDHYGRNGWRVYAVYDGRVRPLQGGLEYRNETHVSERPHTPWALLNNDDPWPAQPEVATGDLRTLRGWLRWDTRNDRLDPATGGLFSLEVEQGLEGDLRIMVDPADPEQTRGVGSEFTTLRLDARRYLRFGPRTRLALRGVASGSPDDGELPPQRQHVLGGEGSLPGYDRMTFDCGARERPLIDDFIPYYGCDRAVLLQLEARYALLDGAFSPGRWLGLDFDLLTTPELVVFADAGRAWVEAESLNGRDPGPRTLRYDAGIGLALGRLGFYVAFPLSEEGDGANIFVRIGPRF